MPLAPQCRAWLEKDGRPVFGDGRARLLEAIGRAGSIKGGAAALGIWLAISPMVILVALAVFGVVFAVSRIMSLATMGAAIAAPPTVAALGLPHHYLLLAILMTALILFRHRENIQRLSRGEEPRFQPKRSDSAASS